MTEKILVTGATGKVGREVVRGVLASGVEVIAGTRSPERGREMFGSEVEVVELDYDRAVTYDAAVQWADRLFLVPPPFAPDAYETLASFLDWAVSSGVRHVVLLSAMTAERVVGLALRKVETHLEEVGVEYTLLRPNLYMQNFSPGFLSESIRSRGEIRLPAGDAEVSLVDGRDVAAVATRALSSDEHFGAAYTLTGPRALDLHEAARILSEAAGREIRYRSVPDREMREWLEERGWHGAQIEVILGLFESIRDGWRTPVSPDVRRILDREPTSLEAYAREHGDAWR